MVGRNYSIGLLIFAVGTVTCMFATSMETMLFGRLVQAIGVSGPRIAAMAVIRDQFVGEAMARVMSFIMVVFIAVPMIAPMVGQWVLIWFSWQHIFTLLLIVGLLSGIWFFARQPETLTHDRRVPFTWKALAQSLCYIFTHRVLGCSFGIILSSVSCCNARCGLRVSIRVILQWIVA